MSMTASVLGGIGLFLLGMSVMTGGLKALAGSGLRTALRNAAATPLSGAFWGAFVTLIVQSSSATTMTTIGLVSAGLLTFPQGLALVFGANVGTTGTGWLIALIGVRVSLTAYALPMVFVGALIALLGRGRAAAAGSALAGFALVLYGLTTLQDGMSGLSERLHPADLPAVMGPDVTWAASVTGVLALIALGLAMTAVMQSSTAAIAVTLSAHFAGAVALDQACALIIGQNIGTATSSAMAAIGASSTAKRLAIAYILFKLFAALIALALFPVTMPLLVRASRTVDGVTLLAAYHTAYNILGVAVLLPMIDRFTQFVERLLPERRSPLTRCLDPAALVTPLATEEAVRRTVARALEAMCNAVAASLHAAPGPTGRLAKNQRSLADAGDALREAREFMAEASGPPESDEEQDQLTRTLLALNEASRLAEVAGEKGDLAHASDSPEDMRAVDLCMQAMGDAAALGARLGALPVASRTADPRETSETDSMDDGGVAPTLARLETSVRTLREVQHVHRGRTLGAATAGALGADEAIARVDTVRRLESIALHAWLCAVHLAGGDAASPEPLQ